MTSFLIENAEGIMTGLPGAAMRAAGSIRVKDGVIEAVGDLAPQPGEARLDASGCVVYPGLISTHHHLFQSIMKGVQPGLDMPLFGWLRCVPYTYWAKIDEEGLRTAARIGLVELLLSGATTAADHHYLYADTYRFDPTDVVFEVAEELGLRLVFCRGGATVSRAFDDDKTTPMPTENLDAMIKRVQDAVSRYHDPSPAAMRRVAFAPTTPPYAVEVDELKVIARAAREMGVRLHSHLSETADYVSFCQERFGQKPVAWMAEHEWLGPDVWFAHLVHCDDDELKLLAETGTGMSHCPQSNCRLGSGIAPADRLAALGGAVSLAVDGAASNESADMISEMNSAWHTHRSTKGAGSVNAEEILRWATTGGARVLGYDTLGAIAPGMQADLAIYELSDPRYFGMHDRASAPIIGAGAPRLRRLIRGGRTLVEDGAPVGFDVAKLRADAAKVVAQLAG